MLQLTWLNMSLPLAVVSGTYRSTSQCSMIFPPSLRRSAFPTVPVTVEYALTSLGETLVPILAAIRDWAEEHVGEVLTTQAEHDKARATSAK